MKLTGFLEFADFGFVPTKGKEKPKDEHDGPMPSHHLEYIIRELRKIGVGTKTAKPEDFHTNVSYGDKGTPGALKVVITPFGGMRAVIRKMVPGLNGEPTWLCVKVYQIEDYDDPESAIIQITKDLRQADREGIPGPGKGWDNMEGFAVRLARSINYHSRQNLLLFEGIRALKDNVEYIIRYMLTGYGLQAKGQRRVDEFQVHLKFDEGLGFLEIDGTEIGDKISSWSWQPEPAEFQEWFSPRQNREEVVRAVVESVSSVY